MLDLTLATCLAIWCVSCSTGFLTAVLFGLPRTNAQLTMKKTAVVFCAGSFGGQVALLLVAGPSPLFVVAAVIMTVALVGAIVSLRAAIQRDQTAALNETAGHKA